MERAMDGRRSEDATSSPVLVSNSTDDRFFAEHPFRGFMRQRMMSASDPMRESMQREMEKERIRQEIIAEEIMRRRELEAEVRREMAMEGSLPFLGLPPFGPSMWLDQRYTMLNGHPMPMLTRGEAGLDQSLPFQRKPEAAKMVELRKEQNGDKIMLLAKPVNANLAGIKRIAPTDLAEGDSKKKVKEEWNCALCQVSATSESGLKQHMEGKKHRAREAALRAKAALGGISSLPEKSDKPIVVINNNEAPNMSNGTNKEAISKLKKGKKHGSAAKKKLQTVEAKKKIFKFWCADCKVGCHSEIVFNNHVEGKKHKLQMEALKEKGISVPITSTERIGASEEVNAEDTKNIKEEEVEKTELEPEAEGGTATKVVVVKMEGEGDGEVEHITEMIKTTEVIKPAEFQGDEEMERTTELEREESTAVTEVVGVKTERDAADTSKPVELQGDEEMEQTTEAESEESTAVTEVVGVKTEGKGNAADTSKPVELQGDEEMEQTTEAEREESTAVTEVVEVKTGKRGCCRHKQASEAQGDEKAALTC